jgi:Skp family chaperone for outer membrane proteins
VALSVCLGGTAIAQNKPATGAPASGSAALARTRIAFLNLNEVLKGYDKFKSLRDDLKQKDEMFLEQLKAKNKRAETLMAEQKDAKTTAQRREAIEQELKQIKFDMENIRGDAQKQIVKYQHEQLALMYREVYQVVSEYAAANGIDVVMQYNEEWNDEYHSPQRVVQRMNMTYWPMYYDKGMEITGPVATMLNQRFTAAAGAVKPK